MSSHVHESVLILCRASPIHATNSATAVERPIYKLTERFTNAAAAAPATRAADLAGSAAAGGSKHDGAARRTFFMPAGDIEVVLHRAVGHLTADTLVLNRKGVLKQAKLVDPLAEPPHELKVKGMLLSLTESETLAQLVSMLLAPLQPWWWFCSPKQPLLAPPL